MNFDRNALDRHITGNYGEDQFRGVGCMNNSLEPQTYDPEYEDGYDHLPLVTCPKCGVEVGEDELVIREDTDTMCETCFDNRGYIGTPELRKIVYVESLGIDRLCDVVLHWHDQEQTPETRAVLHRLYDACSALDKAHMLLCDQENVERNAAKGPGFLDSEFNASFEAGLRYEENPNIFARAKELEIGD
ncbi:MAG: hypothetical protein C5B59_13630 [Bacteroidetes bacterium]|nr:MAG: hypothetical protein C5B59_13630 [Bacteroidota bacterium]